MLNRFKQRSQKGMNIIEMMVALAITGIAIAGLTELSFLSADWINKFSNKVDVSVAAKLALEKIGLDLRGARNLGDCYETQTTLRPAVFPSSNNPLYKTGLPSGGLPSYSLSGSTLIVQIPILDKYGWPTLLPVSVDPKHGPNVDTIVYDVEIDPDSEATGTQKYQLRRSVYAGKHDTEVTDDITKGSTVCPGITILKGIIGPLDKSTGKPLIFQVIDQSNPGASAGSLSNVYASSLPLAGGVAVNVEVMRSQGTSKDIALSSFRSEIFFRNRSMVE